MSKKISFLDRTFWITESKDNPKHVAALQILQMPDDASDDYVEQFYQRLLQFESALNPFNCRVQSLWRWPIALKEIDKLDLDYHVQLHELDDLQDKEDLHSFVADLHKEMLDRDKPLWQYHLIKSGKGQHFAIYCKVHHMYGDGFSLIKRFQAGYLPEPSQNDDFKPVWASPMPKRRRSAKQSVLTRVFGGLWGSLLAVKDLLMIFVRLLLKILRISPNYMPIPFSGTKTVLTGQVKKGRLVSSFELDFSRVRALSKRARASANEILLCAFDIGVHRFLRDYGHTFDKGLYTNMPINLRKPGDQSSGNKIAIVPVRLAYGKTDPYLRLRQIIANHRIVIRASQRAQAAAFSGYTIVIQTFALIFEMLHLSNLVRPIGNILISNVPGPDHTVYLRDARLLSNYPISTMTPGGGVNLTLITYNGVANVGLVCCDNKIQSLEPMSQYCLEAFDMLEKCIDDPSLNIEDIGEQAQYKPHTSADEVVEVEGALKTEE